MSRPRAGSKREEFGALNGVPTAVVSPSSSGSEVDSDGPISEERVLRILELIEAEAPHRVSDVAVEFNLSESHLRHLFKQETGLCLGQVLTEQRMRKAAALLAHSNLRIKAIAAAVGYRHTSSFTRAFEKHFAQAPQTFRKGRSRRR